MATRTLKIDLHNHSHFSDGRHSPEKVFAAAQEKGLGAFALTDHNTVGGVIELMALLADTQTSPELIPGMELSLSIGHVLILGIDPRKMAKRFFEKQQIKQGSVAHGMDFPTLKDNLSWVRDQGGVAIAAHPGLPFGLMSLPNQSVLDLYEDGLVQGTEVHNAQLEHTTRFLYPGWHEMVRAFFAETSVPMYAFSDSHKADRVARRYTELTIPQNMTVLEALRSGEGQTSFRGLR